MADVARLGLSVDSSEVKKGATALDDLTNSSAKAEKANGGLQNAFARLEKLLGAIERAVRGVESAVNRMAADASAASAKVDVMGAATATAASKVEMMSLAATSMSVSFGKVETASVGATAAVQRTAAALDKAANSNRAIAAAAAGAETGLAEVAQAAAVAERAIEQQAAAATKAANANTRLSAAVNDNAASAKVGTHHAANLAAQFQDVAVTAAMGMNPLQIALQQGTQMAMVFGAMAAEGGKGASALSLVGSAFAAVLSPASLVIISLTAISAGLLQLVNWAKLAQAGLNGLASILPMIAPYAAAAAAGLALLYAPQIIMGVTSVIALIARLATSLVVLAATAAAANPFGALVLGIGVAIAAMSAFQKDMARILGVDIVAAAKKGVNYVIGSFVAAFNDIKFLWSNFPAIMGAATVGAANLALAAIESLLNKAGGLLNDFIDKVNSALPESLQIGKVGAVGFERLANPAAGTVDAAGSARALQQQQDLNRDYLGAIGGGIAKGATAASAKLKEWAKGLTDVTDKAKKGKTEAEKFSDILAGADRRIASLQAEAAALGLTEEAAARLRYEQELLNQASQKDITLSAAQRAELAAKAAVMASVETAAKKVKEAYDFVRDGIKGFISDLRTGLQNGEGFWKAFGNAAMNVLNKIISKIEDQLVNALMGALNAGGLNWGNIFASAGGSSFGSGGIGHAATGGRVVGPGSGTSDTAGLFALSNGEFVVRAAMAKRYGGLLEAINAGRMTVPGMAAGGYAGNGGGSGGFGPPQIEIINQTGVEATGKAEVGRGRNGQPVIRMILGAVKKDYASGGFDAVTKTRNGIGPAPTRRG